MCLNVFKLFGEESTGQKRGQTDAPSGLADIFVSNVSRESNVLFAKKGAKPLGEVFPYTPRTQKNP